MKFKYQDILDFLEEKPSKKDLSEKLFQMGHEHEINNDIFEIDITPNRGDCLSLIGLARELDFFYDADLSVEYFSESIQRLDINFENLSTSVCPKISFLEMEVEELPHNYKDYLENHFIDMGAKKNNFFTDVSNYISYELGHPTHCFDSSKINGQITFVDKECDEEFETLLGQKVKLKGRNCVFLDNNNIISMAGIMGGQSTSCSKETKKILVECAYFKPESIIGKSIKYNLQSDAAYKFERHVDFSIQELVLRRFIKIVEDHVKIKSIKLSQYAYSKFKENQLEIDINMINRILGTSISLDLYKEILIKLGFKIDEKITVPSFRNDIFSQNDLAEEVARVIGYNNIKNSPINLKKISPTESRRFIDQTKDFFIENGFFEVINFPFDSQNNKNSVSIDNPLDSNKQFLRSSLQESLLQNLLNNERRQKDSIKLFEISDVYEKDKEENINQSLRIGIIASGILGHNHEQFSKRIDEDYLRNLLNKFFKEGRINFTQIDRARLDTKIKNNIFYSEFILQESLIEENIYEPKLKSEIIFKKCKKVSGFPSSARDFSFSISNFSKYDQVIQHINSMQNEYLKESFIFDFYKNEKMNEIKIGVRMVFQSDKKTLSENEIQDSSNKLLAPLLDLDGVKIPGM